jgi:hypothetical protein
MPVFKFRNSNTANATPSSLIAGEIAVNLQDSKMFDGTGSSVVKIMDTVASQPANNVSITGGSIGVTAVSNNATAVRASTLTLAGTSVSTAVSDPANNSSSAIPTDYSTVNVVSQGQGKLKNIFTFTSSGTYTKSGSDVIRLHVLVCGGGGGGRGYSECGGAGGYAEKIIDATSITTVSVTIGGPGSGGAYFGFSPGGGTTSFGSYVSASGGTGANAHIQHNGGLGGLGSGGELNVRGGGGGGHNNMDQYSSSCAPGGEGGIGFFGGGTPGAHTSGAQPADVASWGAGGVAISPSHNGQGGRNGRGGICIIYEYK